MEKHIDTMGFILAAIVISIGLLGDQEARRSENRIQQIRDSLAALRDALRIDRRLPPRDVSELVRRVRVEQDVLIRRARELNTTLIGIVVVVGLDALRLIYFADAEHPLDAPLLVVGLMVGAVATGLYGEFHARTKRSRADLEFRRSDLHKLDELSNELAKAAPSPHADALVADLRERFPEWTLVPELQAIVALKRDDTAGAIAALTGQHENNVDGQNFPILLTTAMTRAGRLDDCLAILQDVSSRQIEGRVLTELVFDLGLANAHRDCLFGPGVTHLPPASADAPERLSFDLGLDDFEETAQLRRLGRSWTAPTQSDVPWEPTRPDHPVTWLWQILNGVEPAGGLARLATWRDATKDAAALESLGFAFLATGAGDEAVEMFDAAIRLNSSSPSGHWGWALAYFDRSWTDKAVTGLKRARTCGLSDGMFELTDAWIHRRTLPEFSRVAHILGSQPSLQDVVDLSLLGITAPASPAPTPQRIVAQRFLAAGQRVHELAR